MSSGGRSHVAVKEWPGLLLSGMLLENLCDSLLLDTYNSIERMNVSSEIQSQCVSYSDSAKV
jgi:hypothetical protein